MGYEKDTDEAQRLYQQNTFIGVGRGADYDESMKAAFADAWTKAKAAGKTRRPLRVAEHYVAGANPIDWCKIVLVDDGG